MRICTHGNAHPVLEVFAHGSGSSRFSRRNRAVAGALESVIGMNRDAIRQMRAPLELEIVSGATHLFEERGALEQVTRLAADWCQRHLA